MPHTLIRTYDSLTRAEDARAELLHLGLPADHVILSANEDEAGPVEGNFWLDAKDEGHGKPREGLLAKIFHTEQRDDAYNNHQARWNANCQLTVHIDDDALDLEARAVDVMARHGGIDVQARTGDRLQ